jgi:hypothetical protein
MNEYSLEHVLSFTGIGEAAPEMIGAVPEGLRVNFYNAGGTVGGPRIRGKVRPVGGDWMTVRPDGVAVVDVRVTFETDDGALILVTYGGTIDFGPSGYEGFARGEIPAVARIRTAPRFSTANPDYAWLNRLHCIGVGEYRASTRTASYDVYAVR